MKEDDSYCTSIQFNVTSYSSIPDENSSINITIYADDNKLFRGATGTTLNIIAIPSAFETNVASQKSNDGDTGYHIMLSGQILKGSQYDNNEVQFTQDLYALFQFELSDTALLTKQNLIQTFTQLVGALLGSIFGLMGAIGGVMSFFEENKLKFKEKGEKQEKINEIRIKHLRQKLDDLLNKQSQKQESALSKNTNTLINETSQQTDFTQSFFPNTQSEIQKIHSLDKTLEIERDIESNDTKYC